MPYKWQLKRLVLSELSWPNKIRTHINLHLSTYLKTWIDFRSEKVGLYEKTIYAIQRQEIVQFSACIAEIFLFSSFCQVLAPVHTTASRFLQFLQNPVLAGSSSITSVHTSIPFAGTYTLPWKLPITLFSSVHVIIFNDLFKF